MSVVIETVSDVLGRTRRRVRFEWQCAHHYPWVVMDRETGREQDAYADWRMAQNHADTSNIYSHRLGSERRYVVRYERPTKRLIMHALRELFGHHV